MDAEWYINRDGHSSGPFSFDQLVTAARSGQLHKADFTWQPGMQDWQPAASVAGLWLPPVPPAATAPPPIPTSEGRSAQQQTGSSRISLISTSETASDKSAMTNSSKEDDTSSYTSFVKRHWRGELSLAKSYWIVGTLLTIVIVIIANALGDILNSANLSPTWLGLCLTTFVVSMYLVSVWQFVGVWRSAGNHIRTTKRRGWAIAARAAVIIGAIRAVVDFSNITGPMLSESVNLATGIDNTPAYEIRLLRGGRELELSGGMPFGTADAVRKFLDAAPTVELVHLNSMGGRIVEGVELLKLFRERKLITYTSANCVSACTIAFLGGSHRYLSEKAQLGFHSASFGGVDQKALPQLNSEMRSVLVEHGVPSWFSDKALSTEASSMWYPTTKELVDAKVVTAVIDPGQFAISGISDWRNATAIEQTIAQVPYARALKQYNPSAYQKILVPFTDAVKFGKSLNELISELQAVFTAQILPDYLRVAPDAPLIRYWRSQTSEMRYLGRNDAQACLEFVDLIPRRPNFNVARLVPADLLAEDTTSLAAMIEATHTMASAPTASPQVIENDLAIVRANLERNTPGSSNVINEPKKHTQQPALLCGSLIAFYDTVMLMPPDRAGRILRSIAHDN